MAFSPLKLTLLLSPLVLALSLAMDVYVPAIPSMTSQFHTTDSVMLMTLNLFMLTAGFMQLFIGPFSDQYGRRSVAMCMSVSFILGSWLCVVSPNAYWLIFFRILQSIGSGGLLVVGFAVVRDCFEGADNAKSYSYLNGIISFSPMFAPFIGSFLDIRFGWHADFYFLVMIGLMALLNVMMFLPETLPVTQRHEIKLWRVLRAYVEIFFNRTFFVYNAVGIFGMSYLYLFCALSPYLIIRELQIPEQSYGYYFCYMGISFFVGSVVCGHLVTRLGVLRTCVLGLVISLLGGLWMVSWYWIKGLTLHGLVFPMLPIGIGGTFCMSAGNSGAMHPFSKWTGTAAALLGALRFLFASLLGALVIGSHISSTLPLGLPAVSQSLLGLLLFGYYYYRQRQS